ncbi:TolC family protein [Oligella ureolytica]|uniref:TolC family protein n=1 Tax=Oligella ureolytica TaxID=90244 RepID=UPI000E0EE5C1|nr:TolC family protein [Oligella ureolytica]
MMMLSTYKNLLALLTLIVISCFSSQAVAATTLDEVLQFALRMDPKLLEARAEQDAAIQNRMASEALHYPTLALTSSHTIAQHHDYESEYRRKTDVGLQGTLNLYSWGGIDASIERDSQKERFAYYKFFETREELGNLIATHYVTAIYLQEALEVANNDLARHQKFLNDLRIVKSHDIGRESEYVQAEARHLNAQSSIIDLERSLETTMSSLNLYSPQKLTVDDLVDPFESLSAEQLFSQYDQAPNPEVHPSILAQEAERDSAEADIDVAQAATRPQINLEGLASRQNRNVAVTLNWDLFNRPADYNTEHATAKLYAASARTDQIVRDITERYETAKINMRQSENQAKVSKRHIEVQRRVASNYAEQFTVSRRSLLEVLDAYADLARTESTYVGARHQFRTSTLAFLLSQAKIASWAGFPENL